MGTNVQDVSILFGKVKSTLLKANSSCYLLTEVSLSVAIPYV